MIQRPKPPVEGEAAAEAADETQAPAPARPPAGEGDRPGLEAPLEALLFVAREPLSPKRLADMLEEDAARVKEALLRLKERYGEGHGVQLAEIAGGWRLLTNPAYADAVAALAGRKVQDRLSQAALETLAIIAYRQPVSRAEIERVRGVGVGPILRTLLEIDLVKVAGREEALGRALLYATTKAFLDRFRLTSGKDLPASLEI